MSLHGNYTVYIRFDQNKGLSALNLIQFSVGTIIKKKTLVLINK
jgi:hypothetical protein